MHTSRRKFIQITGCLTIGFSIGGFSSGYSAPFGDELPESLKRNPNIHAVLVLTQIFSPLNLLWMSYVKLQEKIHMNFD